MIKTKYFSSNYDWLRDHTNTRLSSHAVQLPHMASMQASIKLPFQSVWTVCVAAFLFAAGWALVLLTLRTEADRFHHLGAAILSSVALLLLTMVSRGCITGQSLLFGESIMAPRVLLFTFLFVLLFGAVWSPVAFWLWRPQGDVKFDDYAAPIGLALIAVSYTFLFLLLMWAAGLCWPNSVGPRIWTRASRCWGGDLYRRHLQSYTFSLI